jgi:hypothetical protein
MAETVDQSLQVLGTGVSDEYELVSLERTGFALQDEDAVFIRRNPELEAQRYVVVEGQVRFPGRYALRSRQDRISDVIGWAGGLREEAYAEGIRLMRSTVGRIVVDLQRALKKPGGLEDVEMRPGDRIEIPQVPSTVAVAGAVQEPRSVRFSRGKGVDYYVQRAGGVSKDADEGRMYVVRANGEAVKPGRFLFVWRAWPEIRAGSRIVVPAKSGG